MSNWHGRVCVSDCGWAARIRTRTKVRPCVRVGMVRLRVRKGENGASLQAGIRGLPPFSNSANLSHLGFCGNTACDSHHCSCIGTLDSVISGPIVAFSANSGSTICNGAPLWRFLPTSSADSFCRALSLGLPIGFQPSASAKGSGQALARGISVKDCYKGFYGVFRMIFCDGWRSTFCNENLVFAPGLGCRPAAKISRLRLGRASSRNETPCLLQGQYPSSDQRWCFALTAENTGGLGRGMTGGHHLALRLAPAARTAILKQE